MEGLRENSGDVGESSVDGASQGLYNYKRDGEMMSEDWIKAYPIRAVGKEPLGLRRRSCCAGHGDPFQSLTVTCLGPSR